MKNSNKKNTAADIDAVNEKTITPLQLLQEIEPLLKEYMIGDFEIEDEVINMHFKNGQKFELFINEDVETETVSIDILEFLVHIAGKIRQYEVDNDGKKNKRKKGLEKLGIFVKPVSKEEYERDKKILESFKREYSLLIEKDIWNYLDLLKLLDIAKKNGCETFEEAIKLL